MWTPRTTETDEANRVIQIEGFILLFYCIFSLCRRDFQRTLVLDDDGPVTLPRGTQVLETRHNFLRSIAQ